MEKSIHLPEEMIQHIQSILSKKESARTTILSKSWYNAWLTRPNLDFDDYDYEFPTLSAFVEFVNKSLQRYEELNRKIRRFRLLGNGYDYSISDGIEWTKKAMKLGATHLNINISSWSLVSSALLEELFWSCRPNFIMLTLYGNNYEALKLICKTLITKECGMHDLEEEENVEIHIAWTWSRNLLTNKPRALKFLFTEWTSYTDTDVCMQLTCG